MAADIAKLEIEIDSNGVVTATNRLGGLDGASRKATKSTKSLSKATESYQQRLQKASQGMQTLGMGLTAGVTVPLLAAGAAGVKFAADIEQAELKFGVLLGSAEKGKQAFAGIKEFAASTPLQLEQLASASQVLVQAQEVNADNIVDILRLVGNVSRGESEVMNRVAVNMAQISAVGRATSMDIRQFGMAGINIYQGLADATGKSAAEVQEMISEGKIGYKELIGAMKSLTKGQDLLGKASKTLAGRFSTAMDNFKQAMAGAVEALLPVAEKIINSFITIMQFIRAMPPGMKQTVLVFASLAAAVGPLLLVISQLVPLITTLGPALAAAAAIITGPVGLAIVGLVAGLTAAFVLFKDFRESLQNFFGDVGKRIMDFISSTSDSMREAENRIKSISELDKSTSDYGSAVSDLASTEIQLAKATREGNKQQADRLKYQRALLKQKMFEQINQISEAWDRMNKKRGEGKGSIADRLEKQKKAFSGREKALRKAADEWQAAFDKMGAGVEKLYKIPTLSGVKFVTENQVSKLEKFNAKTGTLLTATVATRDVLVEFRKEILASGKESAEAGMKISKMKSQVSKLAQIVAIYGKTKAAREHMLSQISSPSLREKVRKMIPLIQKMNETIAPRGVKPLTKGTKQLSKYREIVNKLKDDLRGADKKWRIRIEAGDPDAEMKRTKERIESITEALRRLANSPDVSMKEFEQFQKDFTTFHESIDGRWIMTPELEAAMKRFLDLKEKIDRAAAKPIIPAKSFADVAYGQAAIDGMTDAQGRQIQMTDLLNLSWEQFFNTMAKGADDLTLMITTLGKLGHEISKVFEQNFLEKMGDIGQQFGENMAQMAADSDQAIDAAKALSDAFEDQFRMMLKQIPGILARAGAQALLQGISTMNPAMIGLGIGLLGGSFAAGAGVGVMTGSEQAADRSAKGNVFDRAGKRQFADGGVFTNRIIDKPTMFSFANGAALGEMGEAGTEAVMPLRRGSSGRLGVDASGVGTNVVVNIQNYSGQKVEQRERTSGGTRQIDVIIGKTVSRQLREGTHDQAMQSAYGIRRKGVTKV